MRYIWHTTGPRSMQQWLKLSKNKQVREKLKYLESNHFKEHESGKLRAPLNTYDVISMESNSYFTKKPRLYIPVGDGKGPLPTLPDQWKRMRVKGPDRVPTQRHDNVLQAAAPSQAAKIGVFDPKSPATEELQAKFSPETQMATFIKQTRDLLSLLYGGHKDKVEGGLDQHMRALTSQNLVLLDELKSLNDNVIQMRNFFDDYKERKARVFEEEDLRTPTMEDVSLAEFFRTMPPDVWDFIFQQS